MRSACPPRRGAWGDAGDRPAAVVSAPFSNHRNSYQGIVSRFHQNTGPHWKKEVDPGSEADHPQPLALLHDRADFVIGDDPSGNEAGDLANQHLAPVRE